MRKWLQGKRNHIGSFEILKHGNAQIDLVHETDFGDIGELREMEKYWISKFKTVNKLTLSVVRKICPTRTFGIFWCWEINDFWFLSVLKTSDRLIISNSSWHEDFCDCKKMFSLLEQK